VGQGRPAGFQARMCLNNESKAKTASSLCGLENSMARIFQGPIEVLYSRISTEAANLGTKSSGGSLPFIFALIGGSSRS